MCLSCIDDTASNEGSMELNRRFLRINFIREATLRAAKCGLFLEVQAQKNAQSQVIRRNRIVRDVVWY